MEPLVTKKKTNYALRANMTKAEFIKEVTYGLLPPPQYFPLNVKMNKEGYEDIEDILERGTKPLTPLQFEHLATEIGAIVLDVRHQNEFTKGHIPRSIFIGIKVDFAPSVGALIADVEQPILLVTPEGKEEETIIRLSRVGFDKTLGYLKGGFEAWKHAGLEYDTVTSISASELKQTLDNEDVLIFDVRKDGEFKSEHVKDAHHTSLDYLNEHLNEFPEEKTFYVHCAGGYRSMIAASILKSRGIHNLIDITGGFEAIKQVKIPITDYICPTTL